MAEEEEMPPFWLQPNTGRHGRRRSSQLSSMFLNSGLLLVILLVIAFIFAFHVVPSFLSFSSQVLRPHSIKKGWDSLNLVLVLFAIVCGFLGRNNNDNNSNNKINNHEGARYYEDQQITNVQQDAQRSYTSTPHRWHDQYHDRTAAFVGLNRLRSFGSYPDLRLESSWLANDEQWRFHDDTHLNSYRFSSSDQLHHDHHHRQEQRQEPKKEEESKDIGVDTYVLEEKEVVYTPPPQPSSPRSPSPPPSSPPPPPPSKTVRRKVKRTYRALGNEKRSEEDKDLNFENSSVPPPSPPPPPPPPLFSKYEKRRGKDFLTNLRRRKKKQRQKSVENLESLFNPEPSIASFIPSPPPPPPPPHFLQNLFSYKKGKTKKILSLPTPPPPPIPPPPTISSASLTRGSKIVAKNVSPPPLESRASRTKATQVAPVTSHDDKQPKQVKTSRLKSMEENVDSGNASPLIPIPPPPPPPPFRMQPWRFVLDGDYVRVASFNSSRSGSPDLESLEDPSDKESSSPVATAVYGGGGDIVTMPLSCPSPDVNTKADNFIARVRAGLRMEKVNSVKGRSNLGPELISGPEGEGPS